MLPLCKTHEYKFFAETHDLFVHPSLSATPDINSEHVTILNNDGHYSAVIESLNWLKEYIHEGTTPPQ